jgi:hypothetical protein
MPQTKMAKFYFLGKFAKAPASHLAKLLKLICESAMRVA